MAATQLSIIIPAFNEDMYLEQILTQLAEAVRAIGHDGKHEIIVCDNNSTDNTAELAKKLGAKLVFEAVNQIARREILEPKK